MKPHPNAVALKHDQCGGVAFVWLRRKMGRRGYKLTDFRRVNGKPIAMIGRLRCDSSGGQVGLTERYVAGEWQPAVIEAPSWAKG